MLTQKIYDDRPNKGLNGQNWVLPNGTTLGQYSIISTLREDNSSITYLAQNTFLDYEVELREHLPKMFAERDNYTFEVIPSAGNEHNYQASLSRFSNAISALAQQQQPNIAEVLAFFSALGTTYSVSPHYTDSPLTQAAPPPSAISESWLAPVLISLLKSLHNLNTIGIAYSDINSKNVLITETGSPILINIDVQNTDNKEDKQIPALGELCYRLIRGESSGVMGGLYSYKPLSSDSSLIGRFSPPFLKSIDKALAPYSNNRWKSVEEWIEELEKASSANITTSPMRPGVTVIEGVVPIITVTIQDNVSETDELIPIPAVGDFSEMPIDRESETSPSEENPEDSSAVDSADVPETIFDTDIPELPKAEDSVDVPETCINTKLPEAPAAEDSADVPETCINTKLPEAPAAEDSVDMPETIFSTDIPEAPAAEDSVDMPETIFSTDIPELPAAEDSVDMPETIFSTDIPELPAAEDSVDMPETIFNTDIPELPKAEDSADMTEPSINIERLAIPVEKEIEDMSVTSRSTENGTPLSGQHQQLHVDVKELSFTSMPTAEELPPIIPMPPPADEDEEDLTLTPPPGQALPPVPQPRQSDSEYPKIPVEEFGIDHLTAFHGSSQEEQQSASKLGVKVAIEDIGISSTNAQQSYYSRPAGLTSSSVIKVDDLPIGTNNLTHPQTPEPFSAPTPKKKKGCLNLFLLLVLLLLIALGVVYFMEGSEFIIEQIHYLRSELETMLHG